MSDETLWQKFHVGQRVWRKEACPAGADGEIVPTIGEIYTIRELLLCPYSNDPACRLVEIRNEPREYFVFGGGVKTYECAWRLEKFEPVREQNIEQFRKICRDAETKVSA